ncbi:MAG: cell division protein [Caulobacteraceae bacterium]
MRLVEFGALMVLLTMVLGVYLAKAAAGRERGDITAVQTQIDEEGKRLRLLQAEVAHLEEPQRLVRLSAQIGLQPTNAKHEGSLEELPRIAQAALIPERGDKKASPAAAQPTAIQAVAAQIPAAHGAPQ